MAHKWILTIVFNSIVLICLGQTSNGQQSNVDSLIINLVPKNYQLILIDDFNYFDSSNWSKGLTHDVDPSIKMIWNKNTGG